MYITAPPRPLPAECSHFALFITATDTDIDKILTTARTGRAVKPHSDYGTEVFSVVFVDDGDNRVMTLSEEQLRDELIRRGGGISLTHG
ncbi:MAG: hypothetical protein UV82_C0010G0012 [Candidatus Magasanikbacteria bacterium GW2011_GWD2_43_18]|uniref:Uncharacterized protein n=1 Tax=Candidatus Magasanikbacteria bacterium GW2011_GWE2_42_7 TaxID=1619052 RepID=A0A0G1BC38_9BACT|nr:MAG: hypothetical protein UV18_C0005G0171 [Candidatus Magasanikbacteria bacterium GW2011_GWC2_42_27]KKS70744.1 MAG: hypothetical protein UV42_C0045G0012 [Candidatus Magasanikbacteria bacterium GW2011_GWE2_42_7]KKT04196.1 MAG: hypothetical protein UV82_C0010G0012 [Candidatus Magasanikbacteria bacterium GW2011_GWD2_43_18]KKT25891.1 MAG: hypothetical protein UW10_C0003G0052 [Candidatus Magasanikbacteria bacterium GW2011_GWA2_43_9]HBB37869.1 hypothetical protein [Candidatus Magasanikbacteria bac